MRQIEWRRTPAASLYLKRKSLRFVVGAKPNADFLLENKRHRIASMGDLIWVGNTLLPRGLVWGVGIIIALIVIGAFTVLTDDRSATR